MCFTFLSAVISWAVGDALQTDKQRIQKVLPENFREAFVQALIAGS